jgi:transposase
MPQELTLVTKRITWRSRHRGRSIGAALWLHNGRVERLGGMVKGTVAMQSTGVHWIPVYDLLEEAGFEVYLVNARETKNLPGRKSDVRESQWLMKLHTYGLLRNSFRPSQEIRIMRTYWRHRNDLVRSAGRHIQRIQKALTQMNLQLANVLSDVRGVMAKPSSRRFSLENAIR